VRFNHYEIVALRDLGEHAEECKEKDADFWGLYGITDNNNAYAIGDFSSREDAEFIKDAIKPSA